jgi:hypothetical protein
MHKHHRDGVVNAAISVAIYPINVAGLCYGAGRDRV